MMIYHLVKMSIGVSVEENTLKYETIIIKITTENWRLMKLCLKVIAKLNASEANRYLNQIRYFQKTIHDRLDEVDMKLINLEGEVFDPGMAATPLNIDEFKIEDKLLVEQMIEPLIMKDGNIKKQAIISLKKVDS